MSEKTKKYIAAAALAVIPVLVAIFIVVGKNAAEKDNEITDNDAPDSLSCPYIRDAYHSGQMSLDDFLASGCA